MNLVDPSRMKVVRGMDVVFCRNVLIYFDEAAKKKVAASLYDSLNPNGYLFIGHSESLHTISRAFKLVTVNKMLVYQKGLAGTTIMSKQILVVDDCSTTRKLLSIILKGRGYATIAAEKRNRRPGEARPARRGPGRDGPQHAADGRPGADPDDPGKRGHEEPPRRDGHDRVGRDGQEAGHRDRRERLPDETGDEGSVGLQKWPNYFREGNDMSDLKMKILVVDDFSTMRRIIKNILRQIGYQEIGEAEDGQAALAKLKVDKFDFVVTDWNMPNMTGLELLQAMRAEPRSRTFRSSWSRPSPSRRTSSRPSRPA